MSYITNEILLFNHTMLSATTNHNRLVKNIITLICSYNSGMICIYLEKYQLGKIPFAYQKEEKNGRW